MKQLIIVRHAKSSWDNITQTDFERPLNTRGNRDAPEMAKRLLKRDLKIDAFVSSPANRAFTTATFFAEAFDTKKKDIQQVDILYHASVGTFYKVISELNDEYKTVVLFSHNPGITDFVNSLTNYRIDNMPTCGVFAIQIDCKNWKNFEDAKKELLFFDYPKLG